MTRAADGILHSVRETGQRRRAIWREDLLVDAGSVLLLWLLLLLFFWRLVTPDASARLEIAPGDFTNQFYPFQAFVAAELHQGRLPIWNPYIFAGHPAAGDPLTSASYPLGLLIDYCLGADGFTMLDMEWRLIVHYALGALFTYVFARDLVGRRLGGLIAAASFTFSGFMLSYPMQASPIVETTIWLPLALWFIWRARRYGNRWAANISFAGGTLGLAFLVGHPQTAMYVAYATLLYLLYSTWEARWPPWKVLVGAVGLGCVAMAAAAAQLLPSLEFFPLSSRLDLRPTAISHGYELSSLLGVILPNWRNEKALYVGIAPLALALLALRHRLKEVTFWSLLAIGSLLLSLGGNLPTFRVLVRVVPGLGMVQDQERVAVLFAFSLSILSAYGLTWLFRPHQQVARLPLTPLLPFFLVLGLVALVPFLTTEWRGSTAFQPGLYGGILSGYALFLVLFMATLVVSWAIARRPGQLPIPFYVVLLVGLLLGDSFLVNWNNNFAPPPSVSPLAKAAATFDFLHSQPGVFRLRAENNSVLPANYPALAGLAGMVGDAPMRVKRIDELIGSNEEWRNWMLFNVEYVVAQKDYGEGTKLVFRDGDLKTYRNLYGLPRAYAVTSYRIASSPAESLTMALDPKHHPGDSVVLEQAPSFAISDMARERPEVEITAISPQRILIHANAKGNAMLVVSDTYYPGWQAYLDDVPVRIYVANHAFRAVELPNGEHTIEMRYQPLSFSIGALISAAAFLSVLGLALAGRLGSASSSSLQTQRPQGDARVDR